MAHIDFEDNLFLGRGTFEERNLFRAAGFTWSPSRRCWVTPQYQIAKRVDGAVWLTRATDHIESQLKTAEVSVELSWRADTDYVPPSPPGKTYLPYQRAGIEYALMRKDTLIADQPGLGKAQPLDAPVMTPTGWRTIGELSVGDAVIHPYHGPQRVVGVYDRGVMDVWRVTFSDGSSTLCSGDHLWTYRPPQYRQRGTKVEVHPTWRTESLVDLVERYKGYKTLQSAKLRIPMARAIEMHAEQSHVIDPYTMGALLGDGGCKSHAVYLTSVDNAILDRVREGLPAELSLTHSDRCTYRIASAAAGVANPYTRELKRLGIMGLGSDDKFIPDDYLYDSLENRIALLQGLLDTDGYVAKDGTVQFTSNSRALVQGVRQLVQSVGGVARLSSKISASGKTHWITTLNIPEGIQPFHLPRKVARYGHKAKYPPTRFFASIERVADQAVRCIKVEHDDGLYLTDEFIVTHNTIQAIGVLNADETINRALFIVPASLKVNWFREIDRWMVPDLTFGIAEAKRIEKRQVGWTKAYEKVEDGVYKSGPKAGQTKYKKVEVQGKPKYETVEIKDYWPDTDIVIINYDILDRFTNQIKGIEWDYLVCDECHALKTDGTGRTLFVLGGHRDFNAEQRKARRAKGLPTGREYHKAIDARRRVFLSGTPLLSRPIELWPICRAFDPADLGHNFENFAYKYCGAYSTAYGLDTSGATNLEELGNKARGAFMVRRMKREVLPELPQKIRAVVTLDSPEIRGLVAREDELAQALNMYVALQKGGLNLSDEEEASQGEQIINFMAKVGAADIDDPDSPNWRSLDLDYAASVAGLELPAVQIMFEEIALVRRDLGLAKLTAAIPWIKDFLDGGEKLLVFAYHSDVVKALAEALADYMPAVIWGGTPMHKRQLEVDRFQENEHCRVFIGNIAAAGVGFTLTRAADVVFVEQDWVPAMIEQCEDRACRIGQTAEQINSYFLVANGSLDARMAQSTKAKEDNIAVAMGA